MFNAVNAVKNQNLAAVDSVPAVKAAFTKFENKFNEIETVLQLQIKNIKGYAAVKNDLTVSLCSSATTLSAALFAYGVSSNNQLIKEGSDYTHSDFTRMRDTILVENCYNLHKLADDNLAALVPYNIDAPFLTSFLTLVQQTETANPSPTVERSHRKAYTSQLNVLFREAMNILTEEVDKTMLLLKSTYPDFFQHYKNARIIIDLHGKTKATKTEEGIGTVNLVVTAAVDSSLLENVKAVLTSNAVEIETLYTDEEGEVIFEEVKPGNYIITLSLETYNNKQTDEFTIVPGDELSLEISLDASLD
jgi:hypothetical protein